MAAKKKTKKEEVEKEETKAPVEEKETPVLEPKKPPESEEPTKEEEKSEEPKTDDSKITSFVQLDNQEDKPKEAKKIITEEVKDDDVEKEEETGSEEEPKDKEEPDEEKEVEEVKDKDGDEKISSDEVKDWLKDVRPDTTKEVEKSGKPFVKVFLIFIVLLAIGGAVAGGIYYYKYSVSTPTTTEEEEATTEPTSTATPVPEEADYSDITVSILNGSGVAGGAGSVATLIEEFGFSEPNTGNADSYDYTTTTISLKESVPSALYDSIKEKLSETYIIEKSDTALEEDSSYDIIIIVGTKK